jgi:flagellar protein FliS
MDHRLRHFYLESQIKNASPGQLLIMLYDGLIQHAEEAEQEIAAPVIPGDFSRAAHSVSRCIDILTELSTSLNHSVDPSLCGTLADLYHFFTKEFSEALDHHEPKKIGAILRLIRDLRGAWITADRRSNQLQFAAA